MTTKNIHEFDELMKVLGINTNELGCVMLPVEPFDLFGDGRDKLLDPADLYVADDPALFWVNGDVSDKAHITLLYGLMEPAYEQRGAVDKVLETWERPEYLIPENFTFFPAPNGGDYAAIVVTIDDPHLEEAHQRLSYLPHVDTFAVYQSHMTLAYVKFEAAQKWIDILDEAQFHIYPKEGLDYGSEK